MALSSLFSKSFTRKGETSNSPPSRFIQARKTQAGKRKTQVGNEEMKHEHEKRKTDRKTGRKRGENM